MTIDKQILLYLFFSHDPDTFEQNRTQNLHSKKEIGTRQLIPYQEISSRTGVLDAIEKITTLKWNWARHVNRMTDDRWTRQILQ